MITVYVADSGSGLDYSEMGLTINGEFYPYDTTGMRFDVIDGRLDFDPSALGVRFEDVHHMVCGKTSLGIKNAIYVSSL